MIYRRTYAPRLTSTAQPPDEEPVTDGPVSQQRFQAAVRTILARHYTAQIHYRDEPERRLLTASRRAVTCVYLCTLTRSACQEGGVEFVLREGLDRGVKDVGKTVSENYCSYSK